MSPKVDWKKVEEPLTSEAIRESLKMMRGGTLSGAAIQKNFKSSSFEHAVSFVNKVAAIAAEMNHHPEIHLRRLNNVKITITTLCTGNLLGITVLQAAVRKTMD